MVMLDDFVARRAALDVWSKRWVTTAEVKIIADGPESLAIEADRSKHDIARGMLNGDVPVFSFKVERAADIGPSAVRAVLRVHMLRSEALP